MKNRKDIMIFLKDLKHILWLFKQMIVLGIQNDWEGSKEAGMFLKLHLNYESKRK